MRILITGGTGEVGRTAVERLAQHGHTLRVLGRRSSMAVPGEYRVCDVTDFDCLREAMRGMEAAVHLAAIPNPGNGTSPEIYRVNTTGTYNVYQAAAEEGIRRVVVASSINALGYNFGVVPFTLRYFPIDEEHPTHTSDPYSFSKQITEEIAAYFWRREGISSVCLRLPGVFEVTPERQALFERFRRHARETYGTLLALPEAERAERAAALAAKFEALRTARAWEYPLDESIHRDADGMLLFGRSNFWAAIDARDAAQAIEKGLLAEYQGSHPLYVNAERNMVGIASETLARIFFPEVIERRRPLQGDEALVSIERARALIGFAPDHATTL